MNTGLGRSRQISVILFAALIAFASWIKPLDSRADQQLDAAMKTAFATFATARALNAAISLLQSGQITAQLGVGMSVSPGEMLDPINDLVEQFSNFMLVATVALGTQRVLLAVGTHWVVPLALTITALIWAGLYTMGRPRPRWLVQLFTLMLLVRFVVPAVTLGTDGLFQVFLASKYETSQQSLVRIEGQADALGEAEAEPAEKGFVARAKRWYSKGTGFKEQADKFSEAAGRLTENVTDLIIVFLLRIFVFPLALSWLLYASIRALIRPRPGTR